jgi:glycosyltransferase involved in cell wall biosynthesis
MNVIESVSAPIKDKNLPLVTVVTVVYNGEKTIQGTIESCLKQSYPNLEYIIIDGASSDKTVEIISQFQDKISYFLSEPDLGIYDAMNKAIKAANGEWINFMNCGDIFVNENVLSTVADIIANDKSNVDIFYGNTIFKYNDFFLKQKPMDLNRIEREMAFCHQSTFVKMDIIKQDTFDLNYKLSSDFIMMNRFYKQNKKFKYIDIYISLFDQTDGSTLRNYQKSIKERFLVFDDMSSIKKTILCNKAILRMSFGLFVRKMLPKKYKNYFFMRRNRENIFFNISDL